MKAMQIITSITTHRMVQKGVKYSTSAFEFIDAERIIYFLSASKVV